MTVFTVRKKSVLMMTFCIHVSLHFYRDRKLYKLGLKGFYVKDDNDSTGKVMKCMVQHDVQLKWIMCGHLKHRKAV